jgi:opacity protein-like surface antigen
MVSSASALAETYIAGQLGASFPFPASGIETTGTGVAPGTTGSDLALKNGFAFGGKLGHYFDSLPWLGLETEAFTTNPHIKQQTVFVKEPGVGAGPVATSGSYFNVTTWAFNVLARYPGETFQPYVGLGMGVFFGNLKDAQTGDTQSDTVPGLNALAGLRCLLTDEVVLFGEYKFNYARFNFPETTNLLGLNMTYAAQLVMVGIGYQF